MRKPEEGEMQRLTEEEFFQEMEAYIECLPRTERVGTFVLKGCSDCIAIDSPPPAKTCYDN